MTVRFASFNVENLFARPRAFNQATWAEGQPILEAFANFNSLIELTAYSAADKARMIELLVQLDVYRETNGIVRRNRTPTPFKSQAGGGGPKRARQALGVRGIVDGLVAAGQRHIVVMGDLNEGPAVMGQPAANRIRVLAAVVLRRGDRTGFRGPAGAGAGQAGTTGGAQAHRRGVRLLRAATGRRPRPAPSRPGRADPGRIRGARASPLDRASAGPTPGGEHQPQKSLTPSPRPRPRPRSPPQAMASA